MTTSKSRVHPFFRVIAVLSLCFPAAGSLSAESRHETDPQSGVQTWELHDQGVGFTLMQITPDQARAFFLARGFDRAAVDDYASHCIFMTIVRNETVEDPITYNLADWRFYRKNGTPGKLKLKDDWLTAWRQRKFAQPVLIAFEWSQHPTTQTFEKGDWNQGMTSYAMPLGSVFDLQFQWKVKGAIHESRLENIQCASETSDR